MAGHDGDLDHVLVEIDAAQAGGKRQAQAQVLG